MKMKKLTALALAGVLCLGMSTTALAANSPLPDDAVQATNKDGLTVTINNSPISETDADYNFTGWDDPDPEVANKNAKASLKARLEEIEDILDEDEGDLTPNQKAALEQERDGLLSLGVNDRKVAFEMMSLADISADNMVVDEENPLTIRFILTDYEGIEDIETVNLMHFIDGYWYVYPYEVVHVGDVYYIEHDFTHLSPVAIIKGQTKAPGEDDTPTVIPPTTEDPTEDPALTPDVNGSITADQLADLIVKKLQQNASATKVVRTAVSGKASPKTGE